MIEAAMSGMMPAMMKISIGEQVHDLPEKRKGHPPRPPVPLRPVAEPVPCLKISVGSVRMFVPEEWPAWPG
jgi:hypothetical protein